MKNFITLITDNIIASITILTVILLISSYSFISKSAMNSGQFLTNRSEIIFVNDTVINNIHTLSIYDSIYNSTFFIHHKKADDIYTTNRILNQYKTIRYRTNAHNNTIDFFIIHLYYFIILQVIFMITTITLGLVISKKGWGDTSDKILCIFLISVAILLFSKIVPIGLKFEENLLTNKHHYKMYVHIENEIQTYLSNDEIKQKTPT